MMIFVSPKVKEQKKFGSKSNSCNRGAKKVLIIFPPIFMLSLWVYMHDIR
jgi:hypothetical protein